MDFSLQNGISPFESPDAALASRGNHRIDRSLVDNGLIALQYDRTEVRQNQNGRSSSYFRNSPSINPIGSMETRFRNDAYNRPQDQNYQNLKESDSPEFAPNASSMEEQMLPQFLAESRSIRGTRPLTRSHSPHNRAGTNSRVTKPGKAKRSNKNATKTPHLDKPLSELTKDMDIPVRNMEEWVNRPLGVRLKEVEKRNGYITRPMNSFMLYRSAYAERSKQYCIQNNHQIVSAVSGQSWPKEPIEVREYYNRLAQVERDNHTRAHPNYKFSPSKGASTSHHRKRKDVVSEEESDGGSSEVDAIADQDSVPQFDRPLQDGGNRGLDRYNIPGDVQALNFNSGSFDHYFANQTMRPLDQMDYTQSNRTQPSKNQVDWHVLQSLNASPVLLQEHQHCWKDSMHMPQYLSYLSNQYPFQQASSVIGIPSADLFGNMQQNYNENPSDDFQIDPMLLHLERQLTPPFDEPATPNDLDEISPLAGPSLLSAASSCMLSKQSALAFPVEGLTLTEDRLHDNHDRFHTEKFDDFDIWMEAAPTSSPISP